MKYILVTLFLFVGMTVYTTIANKYLIFDTPNIRSSHTRPTIRGGGIVFLLSIIFTGVLYHPVYWMPILGAVLIGLISFIDDNIGVSQFVRLIVHFVAIALLFYFLNVYTTVSILGIAALCVLVIGIINAYNFMDGINGITGLYSLVVLGSLQYINLNQNNFIEPDLIWFPMLACFVFLYYNFRKRARVFAGDVGSICIAFWILFLIGDLVIESGNPVYILFLSVYGVDTVLTIIHRLILKENIFEAHRLHFYQILANDQKVSHLVVSTAYAVIQLGIIYFVITTPFRFIPTFLFSTLPLAAIYIFLKPKLMKPKKAVADPLEKKLPEKNKRTTNSSSLSIQTKTSK